MKNKLKCFPKFPIKFYRKLISYIVTITFVQSSILINNVAFAQSSVREDYHKLGRAGGASRTANNTTVQPTNFQKPPTPVLNIPVYNKKITSYTRPNPLTPQNNTAPSLSATGKSVPDGFTNTWESQQQPKSVDSEKVAPDEILPEGKTNYTAKFQTCSGGAPTYKFSRTSEPHQYYAASVKNFASQSCSRSTIGSFITENSSAGDINGSAQSLASGQGKLGQTAGAAGKSSYFRCQGEEANIEKYEEEVIKAKEMDLKQCIQLAESIQTKELSDQTCKAQASGNYAHNMDMCHSVATDIQSTSEKLLAFAKNHWLAISALLGAVGAGTYMLMSSGHKQKDEVTTNPDGTKKDDSTNNANNNNKKDDTTNAQNSFQDLTQSDMCKYSTKPLECFVTPSCDLKCVSTNFGVPNYAGFQNDTTRINSQNQVVDAANMGLKSNTAGNNSLGGGSSSGSGGPTLNGGSAETGANNTGNGGRPDSKNFDDDDSHHRGGGYADGSSSENDFGRGPASTKSALGKGAAENGRPLTPEESGPILSKEINLFNRIYEVSRVQCVRDLVYCDK